MRLTIICLFLLFGCAFSKSVTKALTESLGQEVIEIGAPLKELPEGLEEEPSMEKEDADTKLASPASKSPQKKATMDTRRKIKDIDRIDGVNQEDDEQRVEKELADIYKDNDYKGDSAEKDAGLRQGNKKSDFVFAPQDINNPKQVEKFRTSPDYIDCKNLKLKDPNLGNFIEVERFRTSIDAIACDRKKLKEQITAAPKSAASTSVSIAVLLLSILSAFYS